MVAQSAVSFWPRTDSWCAPPRDPATECCAQIDPPPDRPDLAIYSQREQDTNGGIMIWNNPDIDTNVGWPWTLLPSITARVRNRSTTTSAVNGIASVSIAPFGIGTARTPLSSQVFNVGPGAVANLVFPLDAVTRAGNQSIGVHVVLKHPKDSNGLNDAGSQVLAAVRTSDTGRSFELSFPVINDSALSRELVLSLNPSPFFVGITSGFGTFAPHEQKIATLSVHVPPAATSDGITVICRDSAGALLGGLTYLIEVDD